MQTEIKKINRGKVSQQVFEDLQQRILNGEFAPNEKLPSESQLAELYGISRLTVRTALQRLSAVGLVDIRVGEGSFVKPLAFRNLMGEVSKIISQSNLEPYLMEFRYYIEKSALSLALVRATEADLNEFFELSNRLYQAATVGDADQYMEVDYLFHYHLCKIAHNPLFEMVYSSIHDLFRETISKNITYMLAQGEEGLLNSSKFHQELVSYLQAGDTELAQRQLNHIINLDIMCETQEQQDTN